MPHYLQLKVPSLTLIGLVLVMSVWNQSLWPEGWNVLIG